MESESLPISDGACVETFDVGSVLAEESSGDQFRTRGGGSLCDVKDTAGVAWSSIPQAVVVAPDCERVGLESSEASSTRPDENPDHCAGTRANLGLSSHRNPPRRRAETPHEY